MALNFKKKEDRKPCSFYLTKQMVEEIRQIAEKENSNMSYVVEEFIQRGINEYKKSEKSMSNKNNSK